MEFKAGWNLKLDLIKTYDFSHNVVGFHNLDISLFNFVFTRLSHSCIVAEQSRLIGVPVFTGHRGKEREVTAAI